MKLMYVYILKCADNSYYTGVSNDPDWRLQQHNDGNDPKAYTHSRRPVELVFCERFYNPNDAIAFEKQVKGWSRKKKEALINNKWDDLPKLSICVNDSSSKNKDRNALRLRSG